MMPSLSIDSDGGIAKAPTNGAVTGSNTLGDTVTYSCDPGYNLVGSATRTCQADLTWTASDPTCEAPTNGAVTGSNSLGDTVTYSCDSGYNLVGSATRTCQADLTWTASAPTCEVVQCLVLTSPTNGAVSGSNSYGDVLSFTCDTGYNLVGSTTLTCQSDGTWSGSSPTCTIVQCRALTPPANGEMSGSRSYQDVMQFTCHSGYERVGAASITCQADGTWSGNVPSCGAVACPILSAPANGAMSGSNFYQDLVQFTCGYGYDLVGNSALTCQSDATWSGSVPTCTPVQCPILTAPLNGAKTGSNFYPNMVQFSCSSGYNLVGNSALTCQADATWSGTVPTCTRKECLLLTAPTNGAMTGSNLYQDVVTFTCNSGYSLLGNPSLTCQADATWSGAVPICPPVECPLLTAPVNGVMFGSNFYQDIIQFSCNPGYELDGSSNLACQVDASWSGSVPTCERVQCPLQADPANGAKTGSNFYEDVVHFTCYSGHDLVGNPTITCQADATWSGAVPTCTRIECPVLTAPVNGAMFGSNFFQDVVEFTCNSGYDRVGTSSLSCQADRTWNGVVPTCTRVQCPMQVAPANGVVTGGNLYQDVVLFTCDTGYELVGTSSLTCQADRTWDGVAPTCTRVECPVLIAPVNGAMTGFNFYQDLLQFTCDTGYDLVGRVSLTCQADRTWDGVAPTCTRVQCPPLPSPVNGASTGDNFYMDTVHFTCNLGYYLIGDSLSTCQADQSWSRNVPSCSDVDECSTLNGGCEQICTNTIGNFQCSCQNGYSLNTDGFACDDVDECASGNGGCEQTCTNHIPSFQCLCDVGYILNVNGFTCDDVNECSSVNGGCEHSCTNNIGSFQCSCLHGYILNTDDRACDDINECSTANGGCNQTCTNLIASFECSCGAGYSLNDDGVSCDDINECNTANGGCSHVCNNTIGSFECFCSTGYMLNVDGFACDDIDECDTANGGCGQFCNNTVGSFSCYCAHGYSLGVDLLACDGFDPVSHLSCSTITTTSVSITWREPVADIMGYGIIYIPTQGFSQHSPKTSVRSAGNTNATIPGLFSGVRYSISILSFGLWNDSANVSIECITGLPPPTNITITLARQDSGLVHWSQPVRTLVLGYRAWLTDKETSSIISSRHLSQSATSANFTSLVPATEYVVSVSCVSNFFEGPQTELLFVTDTDPPVSLFVDGIRYSCVALFWTPPVAKLTRYELKFTSTEGHRNRRSTSSVTLPGNSDNYLIQDLVPATQYVFSLTAVSRFGRSGAITFTGTTGTDPPSDLKVHKVSSTWLYVKWTPPVAAVVSYHLEVLEAASQDEMHFSLMQSVYGPVRQTSLQLVMHDMPGGFVPSPGDVPDYPEFASALWSGPADAYENKFGYLTNPQITQNSLLLWSGPADAYKIKFGYLTNPQITQNSLLLWSGPADAYENKFGYLTNPQITHNSLLLWSGPADAYENTFGYLTNPQITQNSLLLWSGPADAYENTFGYLTNPQITHNSLLLWSGPADAYENKFGYLTNPQITQNSLLLWSGPADAYENKFGYLTNPQITQNSLLLWSGSGDAYENKFGYLTNPQITHNSLLLWSGRGDA
ncbi:hypothetical protein Bbelb_365450 [Branchiostoma belcheri]|nr:hypothetical protein Bbelb_365450 [Branchiostoma belcheri]